MNDKLDQTMKILRSSKVTTDDRGRTVWEGTVETAKLELLSTQMLRKIIDEGDSENTAKLREMADGESGLVARDVDDGRFEVISDEELQHILDGTEKDYAEKKQAEVAEEPSDNPVEPAEDFEIVSTQMLRVILGTELDDEVTEPEETGFNPYDKN